MDIIILRDMYLKQCNGEHAQINHGQRLAVKRIQLVDTVHDTVTILLRYCYDTCSAVHLVARPIVFSA